MDTINQEISERLSAIEQTLERSFESIDRRLAILETAEQNDIPAMAEEVRTALYTFREEAERNLRDVYSRFEVEWDRMETTIERMNTMIERMSEK